MGAGIRSDATVKREKKASKMAMPFMFYFDLGSESLGLPDFIHLLHGQASHNKRYCFYV